MTEYFPEGSDSTFTSPSTKKKFGRFVMVTVAATPTNFFIYAWLLRKGLPATFSNIASATIVTPPTFVATKCWVWGSAGELGPQMLRYWFFTLFNVAVATATLFVLSQAGASSNILTLAPIAVYAVLLVARFTYLERRLFAQPEKS